MRTCTPLIWFEYQMIDIFHILHTVLLDMGLVKCVLNHKLQQMLLSQTEPE